MEGRSDGPSPFHEDLATSPPPRMVLVMRSTIGWGNDDSSGSGESPPDLPVAAREIEDPSCFSPSRMDFSTSYPCAWIWWHALTAGRRNDACGGGRGESRNDACGGGGGESTPDLTVAAMGGADPASSPPASHMALVGRDLPLYVDPAASPPLHMDLSVAAMGGGDTGEGVGHGDNEPRARELQ